MKMKQRDEYNLLIPKDIKDASNNAVAITDISKIEFSIGGIVKEYLSSGTPAVTYDSVNSRFLFPVTEEESALFLVGKCECQMRVHFTDNTIQSSDVVHINVGKCLIKVAGT